MCMYKEGMRAVLNSCISAINQQQYRGRLKLLNVEFNYFKRSIFPAPYHTRSQYTIACSEGSTQSHIYIISGGCNVCAEVGRSVELTASVTSPATSTVPQWGFKVKSVLWHAGGLASGITEEISPNIWGY